MLAGTPGFQSPEQLKVESIGPPSDIYAFSGVLSILFGEQPLLARSESTPDNVQCNYG